MKQSLFTGSLALATVALTLVGCTMKEQEPPPLTGPSEFAQSLSISVSPDVLTQDGASQSVVTIIARGPSGNPLANLSLRAEIVVGGVPTDFGSLSARSVVTDSQGRATLVYTAPASPVGPGVDEFTLVNIGVTPVGSDYGNASSRFGTLRLVPPGVVVPPAGLVAAFTVNPSTPTQSQTVLFDASSSTSPANNPIASYAWNFGDGHTASGRTASHAYGSPGTYVARLTISDGVGRTASASQSITVSPGVSPIAGFTFSPAAPAVSETVFFNAATSSPAPGRQLTGYQWDFGDGSQSQGATSSHAYSRGGAYTVTLTVTQDNGLTATAVQTVTVASGTPTAAFTFSPASPRVGQAVNFNASASTPGPNRRIVSYVWDFGDGTAAQTGVQSAHTFALAGTYTVTLTVTDDAGVTSLVSRSVTIAP